MGVNFPPESTILVEEVDGSGIKKPILHTTGNSKESLRDFLLGITGGRGISSPQSQIFWQKNFIDPASKESELQPAIQGIRTRDFLLGIIGGGREGKANYYLRISRFL